MLGASFCAVLVMFLIGCHAHVEKTTLPLAVFSGNTMGSTYTVKVVAEHPFTEQGKRAVKDAIERVLADIDIKMSTYRDDSELSRFNAHRDATPFSLSRETLEVLSLSQRISKETDGAFDITVSPLVELWGFGRHKKDEDERQIPSPEEIAAAQTRVGYEKMVIDYDAGTVQKTQPDIICDVGAIAPGYATDKVAEAIQQLGYDNYMVEIGGEVRAHGHNPEKEPWRIGIEKPNPEGRSVQRVVPLTDAAISTSGDYRNYFEKDGKRYSHEIDPRTGRPIEHNLASVSVIAPDCASADAYATALMVLGYEQGKTFAEQHTLPVYFIIRTQEGKFETDESSAFTDYLKRFESAEELSPSPKASS
ncbi:MAG TPA: FAD:protein FMN transferase [Candidatus Hydrogenedentes bacterium]|nr:FAD:protein FMN transferase [Candidatus Hydrogenedentota bacterium]HOL77191.1 FAD:protein FMN transferase [Candidatus Hydrogenedentota bacterium]